MTIKEFMSITVPLCIVAAEYHAYEEVCWEYYDTAGNYHWHGYNTGEHEIKAMQQFTVSAGHEEL